jgi:ribosomal protein L19
MNSYFTPEEETSYASRQEIAFFERKHRQALPGFHRHQSLKFKPNVALQFCTGDVITITITKELEGLTFTGICLAIRKTSFSQADCTVLLRNVLFGVGVEVIFSLFYNRAYRVRFEDHLRKSFFYKKNKLFYLKRRPGNQPTRS